MLSERLEKWALSYEAQGVQKGRQEGRQEGEAFALQHLLARCFGAIPPEMVSRIAGVLREEIERWLDRVLDARSLDEVLGQARTDTSCCPCKEGDSQKVTPKGLHE